MSDPQEADFFSDPAISQDLPGYLAAKRTRCAAGSICHREMTAVMLENA